MKFVRNLRGRSDDVRKAKAEHEADKQVRQIGSGVSAVSSGVVEKRQRAWEHEVQPFPLTWSGALLNAIWVSVSGCALERGQEGACQVGLLMDGGTGFGVTRWKEGL